MFTVRSIKLHIFSPTMGLKFYKLIHCIHHTYTYVRKAQHLYKACHRSANRAKEKWGRHRVFFIQTRASKENKKSREKGYTIRLTQRWFLSSEWRNEKKNKQRNTRKMKWKWNVREKVARAILYERDENDYTLLWVV